MANSALRLSHKAFFITADKMLKRISQMTITSPAQFNGIGFGRSSIRYLVRNNPTFLCAKNITNRGYAKDDSSNFGK